MEIKFENGIDSFGIKKPIWFEAKLNIKKLKRLIQIYGNLMMQLPLTKK